jgi:hypothetical protein
MSRSEKRNKKVAKIAIARHTCARHRGMVYRVLLSHAWPNKLDFSGEDEDIAVSTTVQAWESWATLEERACSVAGHPSPTRRRTWSARPRSC